jgi:hypothetical protein
MRQTIVRVRAERLPDRGGKLSGVAEMKRIVFADDARDCHKFASERRKNVESTCFPWDFIV